MCSEQHFKIQDAIKHYYLDGSLKVHPNQGSRFFEQYKRIFSHIN